MYTQAKRTDTALLRIVLRREPVCSIICRHLFLGPPDEPVLPDWVGLLALSFLACAQSCDTPVMLHECLHSGVLTGAECVVNFYMRLQVRRQRAHDGGTDPSAPYFEMICEPEFDI